MAPSFNKEKKSFCFDHLQVIKVAHFSKFCPMCEITGPLCLKVEEKGFCTFFQDGTKNCWDQSTFKLNLIQRSFVLEIKNNCFLLNLSLFSSLLNSGFNGKDIRVFAFAPFFCGFLHSRQTVPFFYHLFFWRETFLFLYVFFFVYKRKLYSHMYKFEERTKKLPCWHF